MISLKADFFGWEMLYKSIERGIIRKTDVIIALTHFVILKHARFLCLGIGEEPSLSRFETGMELLPQGWNYDPDKYALRYIYNGYEIFLLLGQPSNNDFSMSLLNVRTDEVSTIALDVEKIVDKIRGSINDLIPKASKIAERLRRELIDPVHPRSTNEMKTQTNPSDYDGQVSEEESALAQEVKLLRFGSPLKN